MIAAIVVAALAFGGAAFAVWRVIDLGSQVRELTELESGTHRLAVEVGRELDKTDQRVRDVIAWMHEAFGPAQSAQEPPDPPTPPPGDQDEPLGAQEPVRADSGPSGDDLGEAIQAEQGPPTQAITAATPPPRRHRADEPFTGAVSATEIRRAQEAAAEERHTQMLQRVQAEQRPPTDPT